MVANVESMFSVRVAPWHGLGKIVAEAPDSAAAIKLAGLEWDVIKEDVYVGGRKNENYVANVRSDTGDTLGIVTGRYSIVQNSEAFAFTDALVSEGSVTYETAGSLRDGRQVWMLAKLNQEFSVVGDKCNPYLCFVNSHDGTGAVRVLMTPIRVVCQNTLNMAIRGASRSWSTTHIGNMSDKLIEAQRTLGMATEYMSKLDEEAYKLADINITAQKYAEIINEILPIKTKDSVRTAQTIELKRDAITQALRADDIKKFTGTGWAVLNAVSDFVTHAGAVRQTATFNENRFSRVIGGDTLFDKTYDLLKKVA